MKSLLAKLIVLTCLTSSNIALANTDLCIALSNAGTKPVDFAGLVDPGYTYIVNPGNSATLSGDHMVGACRKNDCAVSILILDGTGKNFEIIEHLPRGARITYRNLHQFDVDVNAKVKCVN